MSRLSTIFVASCITVIATSVGIALNAGFNLGRMESAGVALAVLAFLILSNAIANRLRRTDVSGQMADLSRGITDLALQMGDFGRRLAAVEGKVASAQSVGQDRMHSVMGEIGELGSLLRQLAGSVADHEDVLISGQGKSAPPAPVRPQTLQISDMETFEAPLAGPPPRESPVPPPAAPQIPPEQLVGIVRRAVESGRIDIYLQPTVSLPQRKVRYYEAVSRLRDDEDRVLAAEEFVGAAEQGRLIGRIDHAVMMRGMQVLRRLMIRNDDVGIFCNVSAFTLRDSESFAQCQVLLEANRSLAASFVLEFRQAAIRSLDTVGRDRLAALMRIGYRFSLDHVADLRLEPRELAEMGVRFLKVPAAMLLQRGAVATDIAPADLSDLLGRFGIEMIAERIESERAVVDLLDFDVRFGQGFVFSPPRPLRPEPPAGTAVEAKTPRGTPEASKADPPAPLQFQPLGEAQRGGNSVLVRRALGPV